MRATKTLPKTDRLTCTNCLSATVSAAAFFCSLCHCTAKVCWTPSSLHQCYAAPLFFFSLPSLLSVYHVTIIISSSEVKVRNAHTNGVQRMVANRGRRSRNESNEVDKSNSSRSIPSFLSLLFSLPFFHLEPSSCGAFCLDVSLISNSNFVSKYTVEQLRIQSWTALFLSVFPPFSAIAPSSSLTFFTLLPVTARNCSPVEHSSQSPAFSFSFTAVANGQPFSATSNCSSMLMLKKGCKWQQNCGTAAQQCVLTALCCPFTVMTNAMPLMNLFAQSNPILTWKHSLWIIQIGDGQRCCQPSSSSSLVIFIIEHLQNCCMQILIVMVMVQIS